MLKGALDTCAVETAVPEGKYVCVRPDERRADNLSRPGGRHVAAAVSVRSRFSGGAGECLVEAAVVPKVEPVEQAERGSGPE